MENAAYEVKNILVSQKKKKKKNLNSVHLSLLLINMLQEKKDLQSSGSPVHKDMHILENWE